MISFDDFLKVDIRSGTILEARLNSKAKKPAYELTIDFGELGIKKSSAQITDNYSTESLVNANILAVVNFAAKKVAGVNSEVLVLAVICPDGGTTLLTTTKSTQPGSRVL